VIMGVYGYQVFLARDLRLFPIESSNSFISMEEL